MNRARVIENNRIPLIATTLVAAGLYIIISILLGPFDVVLILGAVTFFILIVVVLLFQNRQRMRLP